MDQLKAWSISDVQDTLRRNVAAGPAKAAAAKQMPGGFGIGAVPAPGVERPAGSARAGAMARAEAHKAPAGTVLLGPTLEQKEGMGSGATPHGERGIAGAHASSATSAAIA